MELGGKCAFEKRLVGMFLQHIFNESDSHIVLVLTFKMGDVIIKFVHGFIILCHAQVEFHKLPACGFVVGCDGADLLVDAQGLFPIEALQVYICHALQDVRVPVAVGIALLYHAQGGGVCFARHIQFGETVIDGGKLKIFANCIVNSTPRDKLIYKTAAHAKVHWRELNDAP